MLALKKNYVLSIKDIFDVWCESQAYILHCCIVKLLHSLGFHVHMCARVVTPLGEMAKMILA